MGRLIVVPQHPDQNDAAEQFQGDGAEEQVDAGVAIARVEEFHRPFALEEEQVEQDEADQRSLGVL